MEGAAFAFSLSLAAGLATLLGFALSLLRLGSNDRFLSLALSFAGGAMIFVAFGEILGKAGSALAPQVGEARAGWVALLGFFAGIAVAFLVDRTVPLHLGPASGTRNPRAREDHDHLARARLEPLGMFSAAALAEPLGALLAWDGARADDRLHPAGAHLRHGRRHHGLHLGRRAAARHA